MSRPAGVTQTQYMLEMLRNAGSRGVTSREFVEVAQVFKYTNRISDLRRMGNIIEAIRVKDSLFRYVLKMDGEKLKDGELGIVCATREVSNA